MPVASIIDLYTSMLGWYMYGAMWDVITGTGLIMVPFVAAILQTILEDSEREKKDTRQFVRSLEFRIYSMVVVMVFAAQPYVILFPENMRYTHLACLPANEGESSILERRVERIDYGDTGTTADNHASRFQASLNGREVRIPLWWYIISRLSHAFTLSMKLELPCNPDLRTLVDGLSGIRLHDDLLRREMAQFHKDCYRPSLTLYLRQSQERDFTLPPSLRDNPERELSWIGSRIFLQLDGYYDFYRAKQPVTEFFWIESRDGMVADQYYAGDRGFPYCNEWWEPENSNINGLRTRLLEYFKSQAEWQDTVQGYGGFFNWWADLFMGTDSQRRQDDYFLQIALTSDSSALFGQRFNANLDQATGFWSNLAESFTGGAANIGIFMGSIPQRVEAKTYRTAAPIVQALILMFFIMFLPALLTIGTFDIGKLITLTVVCFTLIFWGYLFALCHYIENFFLESMLTSANDSNWNQHQLMTAVTGQATGDSYSDVALSMSIIEWISRILYVALPVMFSVFLGMVGHHIGNGISNAIAGLGHEVAAAGGRTTREVVETGKSALTRRR
jgi:TraG-like protein, N-terminal region.